MRFHVGPIPDEFTPDDSWRPLREPNPAVMQLFALPIGLAMGAAVAYCWTTQTGMDTSVTVRAADALWTVVGSLLSFPVLIIVHELLHALFNPGGGRRRESIIGIWPSHFLFYAHYSGPLTRERFLTIFAAPFLIISVLPLLLALAGWMPRSWAPVAAWFSVWNALFACGDAFGMLLIGWQVPRGALVQNKGWQTFWKPKRADIPPHGGAEM